MMGLMQMLMGIVKPGPGFDVVHYNLHKTFSTPHGGGGPGSGPIVVSEKLAPFLPWPVVARRWPLRPKTAGKVNRPVKSFYGHFSVLVRAYAYIRSHGAEGLRQVSEAAVVNANYLMHHLKSLYHLPYDRHCKHEFVLSGKLQKEQHGVRTLDIAKRLLDYGVHAPTIYFPLNVDEALMIEPTETETKETLDAFIAAMRRIARRERQKASRVPHYTPVRRLDEHGRPIAIYWKRNKEIPRGISILQLFIDTFPGQSRFPLSAPAFASIRWQ